MRGEESEAYGDVNIVTGFTTLAVPSLRFRVVCALHSPPELEAPSVRFNDLIPVSLPSRRYNKPRENSDSKLRPEVDQIFERGDV